MSAGGECIEIPCDEGTAAVWSALGRERREHIARLFGATVRAQARLEAEELVVRLRELRRLTEDVGEEPAPAPVEPTPAEEEPADVAPANGGRSRYEVRDNGDGTATVQAAAQQDVGLARVRERFEGAREESRRVTQPTDALPRGGRSRMQTVEVTDEAIVDVVRRLKRVSKSRVAIELGYRPGTKGYIAVGEALVRLAHPLAGGPLVEDGRIRNGVGYRLRPGGESAPAPMERTPADHLGVSARHHPAERERTPERAPEPEPEPRQPRTPAPVKVAVMDDDELRAEVLRRCTGRWLGVAGLASLTDHPPARVAQAVQYLMRHQLLRKQPPGVYQTAAKVKA